MNNIKFSIGQKVMVKFNCKWCVGQVKSICFNMGNAVYGIFVKGAKNLKMVLEDEIW